MKSRSVRDKEIVRPRSKDRVINIYVRDKPRSKDRAYDLEKNQSHETGSKMNI